MNKPQPQIISRKAAHMAGLRRYYTGEPCKSGHLAERYVGNGACIACVNSSFKYRQNAFSHELVPFATQRMWIPKGYTFENVQTLEKYLQRCILEHAKHLGQLTTELEEALVMQIDRM